jgi:hypothetical protein
LSDARLFRRSYLAAAAHAGSLRGKMAVTRREIVAAALISCGIGCILWGCSSASSGETIVNRDGTLATIICTITDAGTTKYAVAPFPGESWEAIVAEVHGVGCSKTTTSNLDGDAGVYTSADLYAVESPPDGGVALVACCAGSNTATILIEGELPTGL